jgi:hypothetical protein
MYVSNALPCLIQPWEQERLVGPLAQQGLQAAAAATSPNPLGRPNSTSPYKTAPPCQVHSAYDTPPGVQLVLVVLPTQ